MAVADPPDTMPAGQVSFAVLWLRLRRDHCGDGCRLSVLDGGLHRKGVDPGRVDSEREGEGIRLLAFALAKKKDVISLRVRQSTELNDVSRWAVV